MIDTGSEPNLIKIGCLSPLATLNNSDRLRLTGISDGELLTLGSTTLIVCKEEIIFHVVNDSFPIEQGGILGSAFFNSAAKIDYVNQIVDFRGIQIPFESRETVILPARSNTVLSIRVANPEVGEGFVPRFSLGDGVFTGDALVSHTNGRAFLRAVNTNNHDVKVIIPTKKLIDFSIPDGNDEPALGRGDDAAISVDPSILGQGQTKRGKSLGTAQVNHTLGTVTTTANTMSLDPGFLELFRLNHLNEEERECILNLIKNNKDLFHIPNSKLGHTVVTKHRITTTDSRPIHTKQYRFPPVHKEEIVKQVDELLKNDIIKHSDSPYNSPLWIVPKKPDSKGNKRWRMVIDYRSLNEKTVGDAYPLPNINEILDQLGSAKYFSVFDLASGFHQIPMHEEDACKTAFSTPHGHYEFTRMPFGLKNAPATFQRLMDSVLTGLQGNELFVYLDDIVLYSSSLREHEIKFQKLAERLRKANLKLQPDKCEFLRKEVTYLGHIIGENGVQPDPKKLSAVKEFPRPTEAKNIKQFLGLAGYYRRFIAGFSKIAKPLTDLLKKDIPFVWGDTQEQAFITLRDALCKEPIL